MKFVTADSNPEGTAASRSQRARRGQSPAATPPAATSPATSSSGNPSTSETSGRPRERSTGTTRDAATPSRITSSA
jgi:hypothetical protein